MNPLKKDLQYRSFEHLSTLIGDYKNINLNNKAICSKLLKLFDQGFSYLKLGDEESAYIMLMRFFELSLLLKKSKLYKEDKVHVDSLITRQKLSKTLDTLEVTKESLKKQYELKTLNEQKKQEEILQITISRQENKLPSIKSLSLQDETNISPTEMKDLISKTDFSYLIIDTREKSDFDYAHINLNIVLTNEQKEKKLVDYINIPGSIIENVVWKLEESLRKYDAINSDSNSSNLFTKRNKYDFIILFDNDTTKNSFSRQNSKLLIFKKAIFEFDQNVKLKNEPILLDGGWKQWILFFPGFSTSSITNTDNSVKTEPKPDAKKLNIDYPEIGNVLPMKPKPLTIPNTEPIAKFTSEPTVTLQKQIIPEPIDQTRGSIKIPVVNRSTKPVERVIKMKYEPPKQDPIIKEENINESIKFKPVQPPPSLHTPKVDPPILNPTVDSTNIFESVYRPSRHLNPFEIQSPLMKDGAKKVLDPVTGVFKIYSNPPTRPIKAPLNEEVPAPTVKTYKPNLEIFNERLKSPKENLPEKSKLKRTMSIPNIASLNDDISLSESDNDETKIIIEDKIPLVKKNPPRPVNNRLEDAPKPSNLKQIPNMKAKPNVNRKAKPTMDDGRLHLRIQELDPVYADVNPGLCGIRNFGNTCFMNCVIQCLNGSRYLVDYFLNGHYKRDLNRTNFLGFKGEIADEYAVLSTAIWKGHYQIISPKRFKSLIGQFNEQFLSNEQQDSQEFLLFLLDGLHEDLNRITIRPKITEKENENENLSDSHAATKAWNIHLSMNDSIIVDLFQGQFKSSITCKFCQKQSVKFDAFMYLTLPILSSKCNLYQCLEMFLKSEEMTGECKWKCPRCKTYRDAVKKIDIWKLPPYLIIHLKRFKYQGRWRDKISTYVDYPIENLEMSSFILNNKNKNSFSYRLYGISNHTGTLDGGHYTALCRHLDIDRWFRFDDSDVREIHDESALKSASSYILFYSLN